ncbi:IPT/TIG domain-containing protein [Pandoraea pneumonica]|uniref:IPT/TIG domain-containing protein n=2 Tax=Pandoraea pneumonica TaxID=2508299 RepID=UPI003CF20E7D
MLPSLQRSIESARRRRSPLAPVTWFHWLRALLTLLVLFTVSSSAWAQTPCVTWTPTAGQLSSGSYRYQLPQNSACDPTNDGLYTSPGQNVGTLYDPNDSSSFAVDLGTFPYDILVFTPTANTVETSWTYKLYRNDDTPVYIAVKIPAGVPTLARLSTNSGSTTGGEPVTLTGTNFVSGATVSFGGTLSPSVVVNNPTTITATTPAHVGGTVNVVVNTSGTGGGGGGSATLTNGFTFIAPLPTVTSLFPTGGSNAGGTSVTITGTNFTGATGVNFGATPATNVVVVSNTTITATSPAGTAPVDVTVTTSAGTSAVNAPNDRFTYAPTVTGVSPSSGAMSGGGAATITGTGFTNATSVTFGPNAALPYTIVNDTTITVPSVPGGTGTIDVKVTNSAGISAINASDQYTYLAAPTVTSVAPNVGQAGVGTTVTIRGTGFSTGGAPTVKFGATQATGVTALNDTTMVATSPFGAASTVDVTVTNTNGTSATSANDQFTFVGVPSITSLGTTEGPLAGGTSVTINGSGLKTASAVKFGTVNATSFTVNSDGQITATAPAGSSAGLVDVTVTTIGGTSPTSSADQFNYRAVPTVTGVSPTSGLAAGSDAVVISGSGFTSASTVKFGGVSATNVVFNSSNQLAVRSPPGTGTVDVTVTTTGGTSATNASDQFTYKPVPVVTGLSVTSGGMTGNTKTIITGTGFTGTVGVTFGGSPASSFNIDSDTQLTVYSPSGPSGTVDVVVTTPNGTSATSASSKFTYYPTPTIAGVFPNSAPATGGTAVVISGTNFVSGSTTVSFGGAFVTPSVVTQTSMTVTAPAGTPGPATITVNAPGGTATQSGSFTYTAVPVVTSLSPTTGPLAGGATVTILGSGFTGASSVSFGATTVTPTVNSDSQITVTAPSKTGAGTVDVTVTVPGGGTSATNLNAKFTYAAVPATTTIAPASGPAAGGTTVTISGTGFTNATAVMFATGFGTNLNVVSDTQLTVKAPSGTAGSTADVTVMTPGGTSPPNPSVRYTFIAPPVVTGLSATGGPSAGGTTVTITGSGFTGVTAVTFGGVAGTAVNFISDTQITAVSPAGAGTVDVNVTTPGGVSASGSASKFTYVGPPAVTGLSVTAGPLGGGTILKISGTGFTGTNAVSFGAAVATAFNVDSDTQITATTPVGSAGIVDVRVTTPGGTSAIAAADKYTYVAGPLLTLATPSGGPASGGTTVTLTGANFVVGSTTVTFGGVAATGVTVSSATSLTATTPAGTAGAVDVVVTTPGGSRPLANGFTYYAVPAVSAISPTTGPTAGGTSVVITGTGFSNVTAVSFGGTAATGFTVNSTTQITATSPAGTGAVDVRVTTLGGTSATVSADQFTYAGTPTVTSVTPNNGLTTGGTAVTITGTGFTGATAVKFGTNNASTVTVVSPTQITATSPAGSVGATNVTVTTPGGTSATGAGNQFTYNAPPSINFVTTTLPGSVAGTAGYNQSIQVTGGVAPYVFSITSGAVPTGLAFDPATGALTGKPTAVGSFTFVVQAKDANNLAGTQSFTVQITAPVLSIDTAALPNATVGVAYSQALTGSGGVSPYTYSTTSALPAGLTFANGTISGTPTQTGPFSLAIKMTDSTTGTGAPFSTTKTLTLTVGAAALTLAPTTLPTPVAGQVYSQTMTASGGTAPYRFTVTSGALPAGLALDAASGALTGTPSATGTSTFTVTATDASTGPGTPMTVSKNYTFNISSQVASAPAIQTKVLANSPLTIHATANAVGGPFTRVAIVTPPASGTAVVNGEDIVYTPAGNTNGVVTFTYALTNAVGTSAPIPVSVTVEAVPITAPGLQANVDANGTATIDITTAASGGPFTGANILSVSPANAGTATIVSVTAPAPAAAAGVRLMRAAVAAPTTQYSVRFVPAAAFAGMAVITYTLSNENATSVPGTLQVSVAARKDPSTDPDVSGLIGAQVEAARRFATTQIGNYNQRLEMLHGKGRAPSSNGLNVVLPSPDRDRNVSRCQDVVGISERDACLRGEVSPTAMSKAKSLDVRDPANKGGSGVSTGDANAPDLPGEGANDDQRFAYWTAGTVDFGFANMAANSAAQRSGFKFTTGGVTLGADYRLSDQLSLGAGLGYGHDSTDIGSSGTRSTGDSYSGALYASFRPIPTLFVDAVAGFGTLNFSSRRWVIDSNDFASGKRTGQQFFGSLSAGYEFRNDDWLFSPYGRLTASRSTLDQYSETGAGLNALTYFKQNVNTLSGTLGVRAGFAKATPIGTISPYIRVELQHDFNGQSMAGLAYADIAGSGPVYFVPGSPYGSDRVQVGFGSKLRTGVLIFGLDYSVTTGMGGLQQGVRLTLSAPF